jgi:hypothetical protein
MVLYVQGTYYIFYYICYFREHFVFWYALYCEMECSGCMIGVVSKPVLRGRTSRVAAALGG